MGANVQLWMLKYSLLQQLLLFLRSHVFLLEMKRNISLLHYDRSIHSILLFKHATQDSSVAIVLASLHFICYQKPLVINFIKLEIKQTFIFDILTYNTKLQKQKEDLIKNWYCLKICDVKIDNIRFLNMIPSGVNFHQVNRSNITNVTNFQSEKLFPHTPSHKTHDGSRTAIKKIHNFSYALSDEIGLGLTSKVFKGKNDLTGLPVAIKCIDLKKQMDTLSQQFLNEEIATLEKIKTVQAYHLLKLQGVILTSNNLYIVTEFCEGKDVSKILRQKKGLTQQQAQLIMKQMIKGYRQLYSMGFIHRDMKTSNLLVSNGKVKIADFGFAISQQKCMQKTFTYNAGSPKYMPPESLKFNRYSVKSDIWGMGVIAYELVYGHSPWKSLDEAKLYDLTTTVPIESLFDPNIPVSNHYKTFIVNCLRPNLNERAGPQFIFNFSWPNADQFVQRYEQEKKIPEVIKLPGKNYAVYGSANEIKYESKQMDVDDFANNASIPGQFILLSQLNYCRFLINILKNLRSLNGFQSNQLLVSLSKQAVLTLQILMKGLGEVACTNKNRFDAPNFQNYVKSGDWQNLKQLIIRYDIQFRQELQPSQPLQKNAVIPQTSTLPQTISYLKSSLPQNSRLLDKLITWLQLREILASNSPYQFATIVDIGSIVKEVSIPDQEVNIELVLNRVLKRLSMINL